MKAKINLSFFTCCFLIVFFYSCNTVNFENSKTSEFLFKNYNDSILFTGNAIKMFNNTTREVVFNDSTFIKKIKSSGKIKCYLGTDSLFSFTYAADYMSSFIDDLVLYEDLYKSKYSFEDGYPNWIENTDINNIRSQNKLKREIGWSKFISQLKKEGRYKE